MDACEGGPSYGPENRAPETVTDRHSEHPPWRVNQTGVWRRLESEWCGNAWDSCSQPSANSWTVNSAGPGTRSKREGRENVGDQDLGCPPFLSFTDVLAISDRV